MKEKGFDLDSNGDLLDNESEADRKKTTRSQSERNYAKKIT